jgi:hypothetical protein
LHVDTTPKAPLLALGSELLERRSTLARWKSELTAAVSARTTYAG